MTSIATNEDENEGLHIKLTYNGGECIPNVTTDEDGKLVSIPVESTITFEILCNPNFTDFPATNEFIMINDDTCNPVIQFTHSAGCPVASANAFISYLEENPFVFAIILIVGGFVVAFFGARFLPRVVAAVAGIITFLVVMVICSVCGMLSYIDPSAAEDEGSLVLVILAFVLALGLGVLAGLLMSKFFFYGFVFLGFIGGYFCGGILYSLVFISWCDAYWVLLLL